MLLLLLLVVVAVAVVVVGGVAVVDVPLVAVVVVVVIAVLHRSALTNSPQSHSQVKYLTPLTDPSCRPRTPQLELLLLSNSMPAHMPP